MNKISVMGSNSFVGKNFLKNYPADSIYVRSETNFPQSNIVLYLRSITTNYSSIKDNINVNLVKLAEFLEHLTPAHKLVYISSFFIYGKGDWENNPAREENSGRVLGSYATTKLCAEQLVETYCLENNIPFQIHRLGNVIGVNDNFSAQKNALQHLIGLLKDDKVVYLYNDGNFYRNVILVDEVNRAIKFLIENGEWNQIYNIGHHTNYQFKYLIEYCKSKLNNKSQILTCEPPGFHEKIQLCKSFKMNVDKLKSLGFEWKYSIEEMLDKVL